MARQIATNAAFARSTTWPAVDESAVTENEREVPVQVNGKLRDRVTVPVGIGEAELEAIVPDPPQDRGCP